MKLPEFIEKHGLRLLKVKPTDKNAHVDDGWDMNHWRCTVTSCGRRSMTLTFSMGRGLKGGPTLDGILECLALDAAEVENASGFEDWAGEYGYDTDSRKAERTYKATATQTERLRRLLGDEAYEELLWKVDK